LPEHSYMSYKQHAIQRKAEPDTERERKQMLWIGSVNDKQCRKIIFPIPYTIDRTANYCSFCGNNESN